ncbi:DUF4142 domain-containing protein [Roseiterribacter gracilis]|uniref:DUF4142 domain-containing protein n=1 Tax=Roseiterribacter gracilis TaxID=2812848 RepID=A0A8S8XIJ2_9PROT|nr:hypothetical protein TMPK1_32420 [Rhodospirillales bacterium TMPK1]
MTRFLLTSAAMALCLTACGAQAQTAPGIAKPAPTAPLNAPADSDVDFVKKAATSDMTEIETSKVAVTKATKPDIKKFAQQMIDDHTKLSTEMGTLAKSKNIPVPPRDSSIDDKVKKLSALSGADFDKEYLKGQVDGHKDAAKLFHGDGTKLKDADLRAAVAKATPTIDAHLDHVQKLAAANGVKS